MDLESRRRWEEYTVVKEIMLARTHIPEAPWWIVHVFAGNAGHKVLMRGMKPLCAKDARSFYLAQYGMDASTAEQRQAFLQKVCRRGSQV